MYAKLTESQENQLLQISPSFIDGIEHYPCAVTLASGEFLDFVYIVESKGFLYCWSVLPEEDPGKKSIYLNDVKEIHPSPNRIPALLAADLYEAGETGMGFIVFEMEFSDGEKLSAISGNAVDFVNLPDSRSVSDIVKVRKIEDRDYKSFLQPPEIHFCLFEKK